jgi:hypothetical protein
MNIRDFLSRNRLTLVWLQEQLSRRGYEVEASYLSRIIDGERNGETAVTVRTECEAICRKYSDM